MQKVILTSLFITSLSVNAAEHRHAESHVHGINNVNMVLNNDQLHVTYEMPIVQLVHEEHDEHDDEHNEQHEEGFFAFLENLFGHEEHDEDHDKHDEEHEKHEERHDEHEEHEDHVAEVENVNEKLKEFADHNEIFKLSADAKCTLAKFTPELHKVSSESEHKDVELTYEFKCNNPKALKEIEFSAFEHFDDLDTIIFDALINNKGYSKRIKSKDSKIVL